MSCASPKICLIRQIIFVSFFCSLLQAEPNKLTYSKSHSPGTKCVLMRIMRRWVGNSKELKWIGVGVGVKDVNTLFLEGWFLLIVIPKLPNG